MKARLFDPTKSVSETKTGEIQLGMVKKSIPFQKLPNGEGYFLYFKLNDHPDLVEEAAVDIAIRLTALKLKNPYFVTPEASTIALAHVLRTKYRIPGMIIYKNKQINDVDPVCVQYDTVTSTDKKQLFLDKQKAVEMHGKDIIILDSICTTGGTLRGTYNLLVKAGVPADRIKEATVLFTEGTPRESIEIEKGKDLPLYAFRHMPIVKDLENVEEQSLKK